jgi:myo-inositol-1(or 4)-monophosphatase
MQNDTQRLLDAALEMADVAGRMTLGYFRTGVRPNWKDDRTPVTVADREAESYLRDEVRRRFPTHGVIGEEFGEDASTDGTTWWIDPIDGTKAFLRGVPTYGVLIAVEREGAVLAGVASFPALGETVAAGKGLGTRLNGRTVRVSTVDRMRDAAVTTTDGGRFDELGSHQAWTETMRHFHVRAGWGDAYGYMLVASGRVEAMVDPVVSPWDVAPFPVIIEEAGGRMTDWTGASGFRGGNAVASNGLFHDPLLASLRGQTIE